MKYQYLKGYAEALLGGGVTLTEELPESHTKGAACTLVAPLGRTITARASLLPEARTRVLAQLRDPEVLASLKTARPKTKRETLAEFLYQDVMKQTGDIPRPWTVESQRYFLTLAAQTMDLLGVEERPLVGDLVDTATARKDMGRNPDARYSPLNGGGFGTKEDLYCLQGRALCHVGKLGQPASLPMSVEGRTVCVPSQWVRREDAQARPAIGELVPYDKAREDMDKHPRARYSSSVNPSGVYKVIGSGLFCEAPPHDIRCGDIRNVITGPMLTCQWTRKA